MESLVLDIAEVRIGVRLCGEAEKGAALCRHYFRGFESGKDAVDAELLVVTPERPEDAGEPVKGSPPLTAERRLPIEEAVEWIGERALNDPAFPLSEGTVAACGLGGVLLFDGESGGAGRMFLLSPGRRRFQPLYRLLWMYAAQDLGERGIGLVHGAALAHEGRGFLFLGDSGAGKSTLARNAPGFDVLSDDSPALFRGREAFRIAATPFCQAHMEEGFSPGAHAIAADLEGLYFLERDGTGLIDPVPPVDALSRILQRSVHFFAFLSPRARAGLFDLIHDLCRRVPVFSARFSGEQEMTRFMAAKERRDHGQG